MGLKNRGRVKLFLLLGVVCQYSDVTAPPPTLNNAKSQYILHKEGPYTPPSCLVTHLDLSTLQRQRAGGPIRVPWVPPTQMLPKLCIIAILIYELLIMVTV